MRSATFSAILFLITCTTTLGGETPAPSPRKWVSQVPAVAKDAQSWQSLVQHLMDEKMYYSALVGVERLAVLFTDIDSKDAAYRTMVRLLDLGYPFSLQPQFFTADLEPGNDVSFANSYFLYKAIANQERGMERWAQAYFQKIDQETFPKYLLYSAIRSYTSNDLPAAEQQLKKLLAMKYTDDQAPLFAKGARTLARIYFEKQEYTKSLDIYTAYLLQLNPIEPADWLEAAWNLYNLKRYDEALGYLFNLEAKSANDGNLEKYVLRALIYRENCSESSIESLSQSFEQRYGKLLASITNGVPLPMLKGLRDLKLPENRSYLQTITLLSALARESKNIDRLPSTLQPLARHLYDTEAGHLKDRARLEEDEAIQRSASYLVILHESIKFLQFEVAREKYNPDNAFKREPAAASVRDSESTPDDDFKVTWNQDGAFWRDERLHYKVDIKNKCVK